MELAKVISQNFDATVNDKNFPLFELTVQQYGVDWKFTRLVPKIIIHYGHVIWTIFLNYIFCIVCKFN